MPGGHLATSLTLSATAYYATGSMEAAAGAFAGGFLIDVDHYLDYLFFEKQWRQPGPVSFLQYYFTNRPRKLVLPLHSAELMTALLAVILIHPWPILVGYWVGAAMHLAFDILVNGEYGLTRPFAFYVFSYRASQRFVAEKLVNPVAVSPEAGSRPVRDFFLRWRPIEDQRGEKPVPLGEAGAKRRVRVASPSES
jgi:hypothetical protein